MKENYTREIYFIRHGALPAAYQDVYVGQDSVPLSEQGISEAQAVGRFLSRIPFDVAYAGNLLRVTQTVEAVRTYAPNIPKPNIDSRLNEIDFGDWGLRKFHEVAQADPEGYAKWSLGHWSYRFPNGENIAAFAERTRAFLQSVIETEANSIAIFSHGGVIMSLISDLIGNHRDNTFNVWVERGGVARVRLRADGTARLALIVRPLELETFYHEQ